MGKSSASGITTTLSEFNPLNGLKKGNKYLRVYLFLCLNQSDDTSH